MTAAELLAKQSDVPVKIAFTGFLGGAEPSKRKAREFLARFGARYGVEGREKPKPKLPPRPCVLPTTEQINRAYSLSLKE